jgi:hypothetical protein
MVAQQITVDGKIYKLIGARETEALAIEDAEILSRRGIPTEIVEETSGLLKKHTRYLLYAGDENNVERKRKISNLKRRKIKKCKCK